MTKSNFRILKTAHAYLQTIFKAPIKFQKDPPKIVGVAGTRYILEIRNHTPRPTHYTPQKAQNNVPPLFFEKTGDNKLLIAILNFYWVMKTA